MPLPFRLGCISWRNGQKNATTWEPHRGFTLDPTEVAPTRISNRASPRALFFARGAGVAVHARRVTTCRRVDPRVAGEWRRHAGHARTRDPVRSVRVADQLRRRTRGRGQESQRRPPRPRTAAARRGSPRSGRRRSRSSIGIRISDSMSPATRTPRSSINSAAWPGACA